MKSKYWWSIIFVAIALLSAIEARTYKVGMLVPVTGAKAPGSHVLAQWTQLAAAVAANVTAEWNSGDTFEVNVIDTLSSKFGALTGATNLAADADTYAAILVGLPASDVYDLARFFRIYNIPCMVASSLSDTDSEQEIIPNFFSVHPKLKNIPRVLSAFTSKYQWSKLALIVDQANSALMDSSLWTGTPVTPILADPDNLNQVFSIANLGGFSVFAIATSNSTLSDEILHAGTEQFNLFSTGNAWIIFGSPVSSPHVDAGIIYAEYLELPASNQSLFQSIIDTLPAGPGQAIEQDCAHLFDAIHVLASSIETIASNPSRTALTSAVAASVQIGVSGRIQFDSQGFAISHSYNIWNGAQNTSDHSVISFNLIFELSHGTLLPVGLSVPLFPGGTSVTPDTSIQYFTVAWLIQPGSYSMTVEQMSDVLQYASDAVNGQIVPLYEVPLMPPQTRLRVITWSIGDSEVELIPVATVLNKYDIVGIISDTSSSISALESAILNPYGIVQLSDAATSPSLSDTERYPYFVRTVPPDTVQAKALAAFCKSNGWTEVGIIYSSDSYGIGLHAEMTRIAPNYGLDIIATAALTIGASSHVNELVVYTGVNPRITIILAQDFTTAEAVRTLKAQGARPRALIVSDGGSACMQEPEFYGLTPEDVQGWIGSIYAGGFGAAYESFKTEMETTPVTEGVKMYYDSSSTWTTNLLDTVFVYADTLSRLVTSGRNPRNVTQMVTAMKETNRLMLTGTMRFDSNGDRIGAYELANYVLGQGYLVIGRVSSSDDEVALSRLVTWPDGSTTVPIDVDPKEEKWLKWTSAAGVIFAILAILGIIVSIVNFAVLVHQKDSPVVRVATWQFLLVMVGGCALGFASVLTWIGRPHPYICALRIWLPPISFILIMAPLLTKTWRLHRIFTLGSLKVRPFPLSQLATMCIVLGVVQVIICIFWISLGTIQPKLLNDKNDRTKVYVVCASNNSNKISAYVTYGYLGLLMLIGCYLTFKVRKLPKDFNESRWIGFSIYNTLLFSVVIIIVGYSLSSFPITVQILICVCTCAIATGALCFMVIPKIWILLMHPERRTSSTGTNTRSETSMRDHRPTKPKKQTRRHDYTRQSAASKSASITAQDSM